MNNLPDSPHLERLSSNDSILKVRANWNAWLAPKAVTFFYLFFNIERINLSKVDMNLSRSTYEYHLTISIWMVPGQIIVFEEVFLLYAMQSLSIQRKDINGAKVKVTWSPQRLVIWNIKAWNNKESKNKK